MSDTSLRRQIARCAREAGAEAVAVAVHDYQTSVSWSYHGEEWFHAASTIKVPVLLGLFGEIEAGRLSPDARVHVRNRFISAADGEPYRLESARDSNSVVHAAIGRTLRVRELAHHMIATSSNLATNLLIELIGVERIHEHLGALGVAGGVELRRGVEDNRAWEQGISNRVTADGLRQLLRIIAEDRAFSPESSRAILEILHAQEYNSGIPAGLPEEARIAHKTGEISTAAHDAGIVQLPGRKPYILVVLTRWAEEVQGRNATIAQIARIVHEHTVEDDTEAEGGAGAGGVVVNA